jgi:hypothetical protein
MNDPEIHRKLDNLQKNVYDMFGCLLILGILILIIFVMVSC